MKSIYFYSTNEGLSFAGGCLMQGLIASKDYKIICNVEPNKILSNSFCNPKINAEDIEIKPHDNSEDILIVDETRELASRIIDDDVKKFFESLKAISKSKRVILLYMKDDANQIKFPDELELYVAHLNSKSNLNPKARPLAFGISMEMVQLSKTLDFKYKNNSIVNNFNVTINQSVRASLEIALIPLIEKRFNIDNRNLEGIKYAEQLSKSAGILCYGGHYYQNILSYTYFQEIYKNNEIMKIANNFPELKKSAVIFRWDSWRFWEALIFGCPAIQIDLTKYNCVLQTMPEPWEHYIPIDLSNIEINLDKFCSLCSDDTNYIVKLASNARQWVIENYHPIKIANYILTAMN